jgi:Skp family chaperone for outer membrane proteins
MQSDQNETPVQPAPDPEPAIASADPPAEPQAVTAPEALLAAEPAGESAAELRSRLAQLESENDFARAGLNRKISALTLKLDAANQELEAARSGSQAETQRLQSELIRLQAENARIKEDQDLYKEVGDGQEEAVRKLMDRLDRAQARADAAGRRVAMYTILVLFILLIAVAAVGVCVLIVLKAYGY